MQRITKWLPPALCLLYAFYPSVRILGDTFGFSYELRNPTLCAYLMALLSIISAVYLLWKRHTAGRLERVCSLLIAPLSCVFCLHMLIQAEPARIIPALLCPIAAFAAHFGFKPIRWYSIPITLFAVVSMFSLFFMGFLGWIWYDPSSIQILESTASPDGKYIIETIYIDEGALGSTTVRDTRSAEPVQLLLGRLYPHYEREYLD